MRVKPFAWLSVLAVAALAVVLLLISVDLDDTGGTEDFQAGGSAYSLGDHEQAVVHFTRAIESGDLVGNVLVVAYNNRGLAYQDLGDFERAIADYGEALRLDPGYALAYNNSGLSYANLGDFDSAIADYGEALRLDPGLAFAYGNRGIVFLELGRNEEAERDFAEAERLGLDVPNYP